MKVKLLFAIGVLLFLSVLTWVGFLSFFLGEQIPVIGMRSFVGFLLPLPFFLGLSSIYQYFKSKEDITISLLDAISHVGICAFPLAINGVVLWIMNKYYYYYYHFILSPLPMIFTTPIAMLTGDPAVWCYLYNYGAAWFIFFILYLWTLQRKNIIPVLFTSLIFTILYYFTLPAYLYIADKMIP